MALNVLRGRGKSAPVMPEPLAIGEPDHDVLGCPECGRPLARGVGRCPGCGTRFLAGVPAKRATTFLGVGMLWGMLLGGGFVATVTSLATPDARPGTGTTGGTVTQPGPGTGQQGGQPAVVVPGMVRSSLRQAGDLHVRLAGAGASIEAAIAAKNVDGAQVARLLRAIAADATYGADLAPRLRGWDAAATLSTDLGSFYQVLRDRARDGLKASITDGAAYRAAGKQMVATLGGLAALDASARTLALEAGIDLPPLPAK